ncbi:MAG: GNAT family N-acetyltransferase [Saprospiraceae bacterium]|nr:GNAT family N-acetyltransferase [Saprospiraceae bacterium]
MIRQAHPGDLNSMQELFVDTIRSICSADYTPTQIEAWTSSIHNTSRWLEKINHQYFLVYADYHQILGFGSLELGQYIDMFYIHKQHQRRGIGKQIYHAIEVEALRFQHGQNPVTLSAHVSLTALPFFSGIGFKIEHENTVRIGGVELINYLMKKQLN